MAVKVSHKEQMKWLKENDPILYSELTSDPVGGGGVDTGFSEFVIFLIVFGAIGFGLFKLLYR